MLVDNILEKEIQNLFLPFNMMQWIFLLPKYSFYENFIFFNSRNVDLISFLSVIIPIISFIIRTLAYPVLQFTVIYNFLVNFDCLFVSLGFLISYISNLFYRKLNVCLVLNIQSIFKLYKFDKHNDTTIFNAVSWFGIGIIVLYYASTLGVFFIAFIMDPIDLIISTLHLHFDINIIYASRIVTLINNHMNLWISELDRLSAACLVDKTIIDDPDLKYEHDTDDVASIRMEDFLAENSNSVKDIVRNEWTSLFQGYRKIFETYDVYKKSHQIFILYGGVKCFVAALFYVQYSIELVFDTPHINMKVFNVIICMTSIKNLILLTVISFTNQRFYTSVGKVQCACLNIITKYTKEGSGGKVARQMCKNIVRFNKVSFEKTLACRVYEVDAPQPLRFVGAVVEYVVVLIQIALGRKQ